MKRWIAALLSAVLLLSVSGAALAADPDTVEMLGPVYIGDNARIGAGSVVLRNLPANCTAVGVPAEVVRINNRPA